MVRINVFCAELVFLIRSSQLAALIQLLAATIAYKNLKIFALAANLPMFSALILNIAVKTHTVRHVKV
jgi:hypothetical protein